MSTPVVIYVSGKLSDPRGPWYEEQHTREAEEIAAKLWQAGHAVICPHANTRYFGGLVDGETFIRGDVEIVKRCDAVVMVSNWRDSRGAVAERDAALKAGIPVYYWEESWDRHRLTKALDIGVQQQRVEEGAAQESKWIPPKMQL